MREALEVLLELERGRRTEREPKNEVAFERMELVLKQHLGQGNLGLRPREMISAFSASKV